MNGEPTAPHVADGASGDGGTSQRDLTRGGAHSPRSIAARARFYLVGGAILALAVAFGVFVVAWGQYSISQRAEELGRQVSALAKGQAAADARLRSAEDSTTGAARDLLLSVEAGLMGAGLFVTDANGLVVRATTQDPPPSIPLYRLTRTTASGAVSGVLRSGSGAQLLVVAAPIDAERRLVAIQGLREIRRAQVWILAIGAVALAVAAAVAYIAAGALARRLTAPLVRLESAAEAVAAGAFGTQVAEEGDVETASLARSFNRMSSRVADAYSAQRAFVADVSHEIRTPLTSIRGFAEAMLDGTLTDEAQQERALGVVRDEAIRIGEVSQALLALSELDAGAVDVAHVPIDVALLADALRGRFAVAAQAADVRLTVDLPDEPRPLGDPDRLLQAVSALVTNAIAFTPASGEVRVSSTATGDRWVLWVDDSGPGVPAEKRAEVFGRFSRLGGERSGTGLGLAICKRLVEIMGGEVGVAESDLGGARFELSLPRSPGELNANST